MEGSWTLMTAIGKRKETDGCYINKIPHIGRRLLDTYDCNRKEERNRQVLHKLNSPHWSISLGFGPRNA